MRFKSRKMTVSVVLLLVLIVQVVFAGAKSQDTNSIVAESVTMPVIQEAVANDEGADLITEEEVVSAELNVVYRSNLTSTEVVDEFEGNIDKGDFYNKILSYTVSRLCVYEQPDLTSRVVGVMYSGSEAEIIERGDEWTRITSGEVTGYIRNVAVLFDEEAVAVARIIGTEQTFVNDDSLIVYADPTTSSAQLMTLNKGDEVITMDNSYDGFVMIDSPEGYGYVQKSGLSVSYGLAGAITIEEEAKRKAEEEAAAAKKAAEEAAAAAKKAAAEKYANVATTTRAAYNATPEEIHLLAAIVYYEAGWEPAEGQLAVANIVLNRVLSTRFRQNTIADVIYAQGQFSGVVVNGAVSEKFQNILNMSNEQLNARGCYDAALTALSGVNNIGDLSFFISVRKANYTKYISYTIINNHCFYTY